MYSFFHQPLVRKTLNQALPIMPPVLLSLIGSYIETYQELVTRYCNEPSDVLAQELLKALNTSEPSVVFAFNHLRMQERADFLYHTKDAHFPPALKFYFSSSHDASAINAFYSTREGQALQFLLSEEDKISEEKPRDFVNAGLAAEELKKRYSVQFIELLKLTFLSSVSKQADWLEPTGHVSLAKRPAYEKRIKELMRSVKLFNFDYANIDFSLENAMLQNANFSLAHFNTVSFRKTNFSSSNFVGTSLHGYFQEANFSYCDFTEATSYYSFTCTKSNKTIELASDFSRANFSNAIFKDAIFQSTVFEYANFTGADLSFGSFRYCNFKNARLPENVTACAGDDLRHATLPPSYKEKICKQIDIILASARASHLNPLIDYFKLHTKNNKSADWDECLHALVMMRQTIQNLGQEFIENIPGNLREKRKYLLVGDKMETDFYVALKKVCTLLSEYQRTPSLWRESIYHKPDFYSGSEGTYDPDVRAVRGA